jgi:4'-phosphopantetheinyl transferase EntD
VALQSILPACVTAVETREDLLEAKLFPQEEGTLGEAVDKRRREFTTVRACARTALQRLGIPPAPIPNGQRGEPLWPEGIVGSLTHCDGYRACALARDSLIVTIGIDAEPNAALPRGLLGDIARAEERTWLDRLLGERPTVCWDRLLFSAKESVYKAWFPLAQRWLGFEDAVISVDPGAGSFTARLLVEGPRLEQGPLRGFSGRWTVDEGIILTAIVVNRGARASDIRERP